MYNLDPLKSHQDLNLLSLQEKKKLKRKNAELKRDSFKRLLTYVNYKKGIAFWIVATSILAALCLTIGIFLLGYIMDQFLTYDFLLGKNSITNKENFNEFQFIGNIFLLIVVYIFQQIFSYTSNHLSVKAGVLSSAIIRLDAYKSVMKMPISFFDSINTGELMSILSNDVDNISNGLSGSLNLIITTATVSIVSFGFMFYYSIYLALITLVLFPLMLSLVFVLMKKAMPQFQKQQKELADLNGYIEENLSAHHLIRSLDFNESVNKEFDKRNNVLYKSSFKANLYTGLMWPYSNIVVNFLQLIIVIISASFATANIGTGSNKTFSPGIVMSFVLYIRLMSGNITRLFENIAQVQMMIVSSIRIFNVIDFKPVVDESKLNNIDKIKGNVKFDNVSFSYNGDSNLLQLKDASFNAKKGQVFAIVGPTGAGKTTIINLLSKFYLPNKGTIQIDNFKSSEINEKSWRNQISIVLQDTFLFKTTIMENLRYANLKASDEEILEASRITKADDFIQRLEKGYEEIIEEGGSNLSQGERQLIAITRAIIANKSILILDEATSNVDTRTEKIIQKAMLNLMKGKTSFIIAHRLSTIVNADQILVVKDGQIIERGKHKELLDKKGFYEKLYHSSFSED
ncbi:ABC transporter ATP-binding protein [Metamycoplasma phocicerebrale]|uniref:ABC transporter ATP-binding protein n=1 Tax=Metamycoplasma phocicerebrale TaxID=142649 RepID=A0A3Q9V8R7_9BACT|nr:ABC transporter ATP-binding protein [Metamycoplasma phocicerebrale]AZZ65239.1 ABC transporter ATP-binding protein [Metamycoplasma phocicerebrale]